MTETTASLAVTQKELSLLPTPVSNQPVSELLNMVAAFANDLKQTVRGDIAHSDLIQACFPLYKDFRSKIKSTSPNFVPQLSFEDSAPKEINRLTVATTITKISGSDGSEASIDILPHAIYLDDVRQCIVRYEPFPFCYLGTDNFPSIMLDLELENCLTMSPTRPRLS